jgi:hypothetical protein
MEIGQDAAEHVLSYLHDSGMLGIAYMRDNVYELDLERNIDGRTRMVLKLGFTDEKKAEFIKFVWSKVAELLDDELRNLTDNETGTAEGSGTGQ